MARPRSDIAPRIVRAARERFLCDGVDGASLRQIAEEAGTSIGMVYYYFPSKDDLFLAVVEEVYGALLADLTEALAPRQKPGKSGKSGASAKSDLARPVRERLAALYQRLGALSADELLVVRIVVREVLARPARLTGLIERFRRGHLPMVLALVQDAYAEGLFDPSLPPLVVTGAMMMLGGPVQAILQSVGDRLPLPPVPPGTSLSVLLARIFLRGVGTTAVAPAAPSPRGPAARSGAGPGKGKGGQPSTRPASRRRD
jgi:AcrR family transcriptional regulator